MFVPVIALEPINCGFDELTNAIRMYLHTPLILNGDYRLYSKMGNDGNTLLNECGFPLDEFDTILLRVNDCSDLQMSLENVTVVDNTHPQIQWEIDTSTFPTYLFDRYEVYRSVNFGGFTRIRNLTNFLLTSYDDQSLSRPNVNTNTYQYYLRAIVNGLDIGGTDTITSIRLNDNSVVDETLELSWNDYDGWSNPEYTVMISNDSTNWSAYAGPQTATTFTLPKSDLQASTYVIRVDATDPSSTTYRSASNYVTFEIENSEVEVPTVFTPGGDGVNDQFILANIEQYEDNTLTVYNRWGKKVYETDGYGTNSKYWDGTDQNTGDLLADGVYYWVITYFNTATRKTEEQAGHVHIFNE